MLACTQTSRKTGTHLEKKQQQQQPMVFSRRPFSLEPSHTFDSERVCFVFILLEAKNSAGKGEQYTSYKGQTHNTTNARLGCVAS